MTRCLCVEPMADPPEFCAYCGEAVTPRDTGGALGRRLILCQICANALNALADGADDALAILRGGVGQ